MGYYRVTYEGYIEGEYDSEREAINNFKIAMEEDVEDKNNIAISEFDEITKHWY